MAYTILHFPKQEDRIHDAIRRQLNWQQGIQSQEINVAVKKGVVVLSGSVEMFLERLEAEKAAKAVLGVLSVTNRIQVRPKFERTDDAIAHDVAASLKSIISVTDPSPRVTVHNGVVMLEGKVRGNLQKEDAERAAQTIYGVRQIFNFLQVTTHSFCQPTGGRQGIWIQRRLGRHANGRTAHQASGHCLLCLVSRSSLTMRSWI